LKHPSWVAFVRSVVAQTTDEIYMGKAEQCWPTGWLSGVRVGVFPGQAAGVQQFSMVCVAEEPATRVASQEGMTATSLLSPRGWSRCNAL